jgi:hypothetical protein
MAPDFIANLDPKTGDAHVGGDLGAYKVDAGSRDDRVAEFTPVADAEGY